VVTKLSNYNIEINVIKVAVKIRAISSISLSSRELILFYRHVRLLTKSGEGKK